MANQLACFGEVVVGGSIVSEVVGFSFDQSANSVDDMELNDKFTTVQSDVVSATGSIDALLDRDDATGQALMTVGSVVTLVLRPEGPSSGFTRYTFDALIDSVGIANARGAMVTRKYSYTSTGPVVIDTIP